MQHLQADGTDGFNNNNRKFVNSGQLWAPCKLEKTLYVRFVATGRRDEEMLDNGQ